MNIVPDWAPNVHPMFVHFPISLLLTAIAVDLLSLVGETSVWLRRGAILLYTAGAISAIVAYFTGQSAAVNVTVPAQAETVLTTHEQFALWTLLFFGVYAIVRLIVEQFAEGARQWVRWVLFIIVLPGFYLIWKTGEHGSEMVYVYAVGVRQAASIPPDLASDTSPGRSGIEFTEGGGWSWRPQSAQAFEDSLLRWIEGSPEHLLSQVHGDPAAGILLQPHQVPLMLVVSRDLDDVQMETELNVGHAGVMLVHHVQPNGDYDFLEYQHNTLRLGRFAGGHTTIFDSADVESNGWIRLRAAGDGTHFRGYIDDRLLVHGHTSELPPGPAGLRITEADTLLLRSLTAQPL